MRDMIFEVRLDKQEENLLRFQIILLDIRAIVETNFASIS